MATSADGLLAAVALGAASSAGLLAGAMAGSFGRTRHQRIAVAMSVGAGVLLAAVAIKVGAEALRLAGPMSAALALLLGAAAFSVCNAALAVRGAAHRKRCGECVAQPSEADHRGSGLAIALGHALDAAPEAMMLGAALREPVVPIALAVAFSLGNLPAALSSTAGLRAAGRSYRYIALMWVTIATWTAVATAAGYAGAIGLDAAWLPRLQAFGAGALLAMAAETMMPEAVHGSPRYSGLFATSGFVLLLIVHAITR